MDDQISDKIQAEFQLELVAELLHSKGFEVSSLSDTYIAVSLNRGVSIQEVWMATGMDDSLNYRSIIHHKCVLVSVK